MSASTIMDPHPVVLKPDDTISTAAELVMKYRYRNLPVIDSEGCFVGVFGVNCLLEQALPKSCFMKDGLKNVSFIHETLHDLHERFREIEQHEISRYMKADIETVQPDTPLIETLLLLHKMKTSIPVVEQDTCKLLGMISYWDVGKRILSA